MPYYVKPKEHPFAFKPYDYRQRKRDVHDAGMASQRLSRELRKAPLRIAHAAATARNAAWRKAV